MRKLFLMLALLFCTDVFAQTFQWDGTAGKPKLSVPATQGIGIGDVAAGKYFGLDRYGRYTATGDSAMEYMEIFVKPTGVYRNPVTPTVPDFGAWLWPGHTFLFDAAAPESLFFNVEIPHNAVTGGVLDAHVHWAPTSTNTGKVAWKLAWMIKDIGGTFAFSAGDTLSGQTAGGGTTNAHQYTDLGDISTAAITGVSAIMFGVLIRDADKGSDGYTGDAAFLDLGFHYKVDSFGSRWETKK